MEYLISKYGKNTYDELFNNIKQNTNEYFKLHNITIDSNENNFNLFDIYIKNKLTFISNAVNNEFISYNEIIDNRLQNNDIDGICTLINDELSPNIWKETIEELNEVDKMKKTVHSSDIYKCYKCGERKTNERRLQTRSSDEPMTIFVTCINCGNRWRTG